MYNEKHGNTMELPGNYFEPNTRDIVKKCTENVDIQNFVILNLFPEGLKQLIQIETFAF